MAVRALELHAPLVGRLDALGIEVLRVREREVGLLHDGRRALAHAKQPVAFAEWTGGTADGPARNPIRCATRRSGRARGCRGGNRRRSRRRRDTWASRPCGRGGRWRSACPRTAPPAAPRPRRAGRSRRGTRGRRGRARARKASSWQLAQRCAIGWCASIRGPGFQMRSPKVSFREANFHGRSSTRPAGMSRPSNSKVTANPQATPRFESPSEASVVFAVRLRRSGAISGGLTSSTASAPSYPAGAAIDSSAVGADLDRLALLQAHRRARSCA